MKKMCVRAAGLAPVHDAAPRYHPLSVLTHGSPGSLLEKISTNVSEYLALCFISDILDGELQNR
jgi:hypothetical protein